MQMLRVQRRHLNTGQVNKAGTAQDDKSRLADCTSVRDLLVGVSSSGRRRRSGPPLRGRHELGVRRHVALMQETAALFLLAVAQPVLKQSCVILIFSTSFKI